MTDSVRVPVGSNAIISINYQYPEDWRWANHRWLVQGTGISVGTPDGGLRAGTYNVNVPVSSLPPGVYTFIAYFKTDRGSDAGLGSLSATIEIYNPNTPPVSKKRVYGRS
jgi:hypothetical protein